MRRRSVRRGSVNFSSAGRVAAAIAQHPREFVAIVMSTVAMFAIVINALFLQKGPHPAPIFAARPLLPKETTIPPRLSGAQSHLGSDLAAQARVQLVANIQRELSRKGFYDGPSDGIWGSKTDAAVHDFLQASGLKVNPDANESLLRAISSYVVKPATVAAAPPATDPIAKLIAPSRRIVSIQRALADFGYGQIKLTGVYDPETRSAIEKFERDHRLPVTGQISDRFVRELAAMTGRPLE
ncbi:MAG TPA: peptidoglycan-binding domain-containing protein [Pseudolabrys sp.]|nr:peptidoglycan-binding domain-containing protein [Pseudolabrys sp.]